MKEVILTNKKNGMLVLLLTLLIYAAAIAGVIISGIYELIPLIIICAVILALGWIPLCGLKVLKPQEALVLTLFGKYVGTLKVTVSILSTPSVLL